jgi:hypothetical protein
MFFYPDINNTNYEFVFENNTVRVVDTNREPLPINQSRQLYNALPGFLQQTQLARLLVRLGDPPRDVMTPGGVMKRMHPQFCIYVTSPEVEGYDEGWKRTEHGLEILSHEINQNGGQFAVVSIFPGKELVDSLPGWFPELTQGWQWDANLPDEHLATILGKIPASLIRTRPTYEAYAQEVGTPVHRLLFIQGDGHFNDLGHQMTEKVLFEWLINQGIVK